MHRTKVSRCLMFPCRRGLLVETLVIAQVVQCDDEKIRTSDYLASGDDEQWDQQQQCRGH